MSLSPKQQQFVREYLIDLNATAAYKRAGYKSKTDHVATVQAARLLTKPDIQRAISQAKQARIKRTEITADKTLREIALLAFSSIGGVIDFTGDVFRMKAPKDISLAAQRTIQSVKVRRHVDGHGDDAVTVEVTEFKLWSKEKALELLCRHQGLLEKPDLNAIIDQSIPDPAIRAELRQALAIALREQGGTGSGTAGERPALPAIPAEPGGVQPEGSQGPVVGEAGRDS